MDTRKTWHRMVAAASVVAFAAVAFPAFSTETTAAMAAAAAEAWAKANGEFSAGGCEAMSVTPRHDADGTLLWFEVALAGGGGIAVAPNTEIEPIVAAFGDCGGAIPEGHPLRAMLVRDMRERLASLGSGKPARMRATSASGSNDAAESARMRAEEKWDRLANAADTQAAEETDALNGQGRLKKAVSASGEVFPDQFWSFISDWSCNRLDHWNQRGWNRYVTLDTLYNKYTPNHYPCGCVNTVGAALLQFFGVANAPNVTRECAVDGVSVNLTTKGVNYDWSLFGTRSWSENMALTEAQKDLLGRAIYDVGVCLQTRYTDNGSGASLYDLANALRNDFGLADARYVTEISASNYEKLIYNQVRSQYPVVLGIGAGEKQGLSPDAGHTVLAVGYGEDDSGTAYTRIFMGWGGSGDAWYALPVIGGFEVIDCLVTMIGKSSSVVPVCARVRTTSGDGVAFDNVTVNGNSCGKTTANGFFATRVPVSASAQTYAVQCRGVQQSVSAGSGLSTIQGNCAASELAALLPGTATLTVAPAAGELRVYSSPVDAQVAALAQGKALFALSGADWCGYCGIVKNYIKGLGSSFTGRYVFYYCNIDCDPYGMAHGAPAYGVFDPRLFDYRRGWVASNGMLAYDSGGEEERVRSVLDAGWAAWSTCNAAPVSVVLSGADAVLAPGHYSLRASFQDGADVSVSHGVSWSVTSGNAATISTDGVLTPVAGRTGTVTVRASATLWGQSYSRTKTVRIVNSATITGISVSGPALIDLYDETGGQYRAIATCRDGTTVEVSPEWSVSGENISYAKMTALGELCFSSDTYTVYQRATATVTAVYGGFTASAQTEIYGPGYVYIDEYEVPQNALWPGCAFSITPKKLRWWRHGVLEEPTADLSGVAFFWIIDCPNNKSYSGNGSSISVPAEAFSTSGECTVSVYAKPVSGRYYRLYTQGVSMHLCASRPQMAMVTFDANEGSASFDSMLCAVGKPYGTLPWLTRRGYDGDWYTAREGGERVVFSSIAPSSNTTLHAHWYANYYFIAYDANGGTGSMNSQYSEYDSPQNLQPLAFRREGHAFVGWGLSPDGPAVYGDRECVVNLLEESSGTITLYALWKKLSATSPIVGITLSGPALIDLYDEACGHFTATAICEDGSTMEVMPEWSVESEGAHNVEMSALGDLFPYSVYQCATATVTAAYCGFTASAQTEIYGPGYVNIAAYEIPQNAVWPGCTFSITPKTVRWWRHGILEEPTSDLSDVAFSWRIDCPGDKSYSGVGTSFTIPTDAFSTNGECSVSLFVLPDRERYYLLWGIVGVDPYFFPLEPQMVTVTFDANVGTASFGSMRCAGGKPYGILPQLTRRGYNGEWCTAREGGERVCTSSIAPSTDTTLHARWNANYYYIAYDANGGTGSMPDQCVYYDSPKVLGPIGFRREGHAFVGWGLSPDGPAVYSDRQTVINLGADYGTTTLYAIWNEIHIASPITGISVSGPSLIDLYDETGGRYRAVATCQDGTTVEVSPEWSVSGKNISYAEMSTLGELYFSSDCYTVYQCATATVTAAYGGFTASAQTEIYGPGYVRIEEYEIPQNAVWPGCTLAITPKTVRWWRHGVLEEPTSDFSGVRFSWSIWSGDWYADGAGTTITVPADAVSDTGECSANIYATPLLDRYYNSGGIWLDPHFCAAEPQMVTVTFDANGGTASFGSMRCVGGKPYGILPKLTRGGYSGDWYAALDGDERVYSSSIAPSTDTTIHARWYPKRYYIAYDANGGTGAMSDQCVYYDSPVTLAALAFRREGHNFAGWGLSPDGPAVYSDRQTVANLRDDYGTATLYAIWNEIHITSPITGISISGPSLIDLYDETGGRYRAIATCRDGTTVEVSPEWSVSGENINYAEMTTLGELYFSSDRYTVYQRATATVTAVYGGFTATAQTEIYGPGYVRIEEYEIPQNAVWPGCTLAITPKTVRWWRHGVLEEPTSDFSGVRFSWSIWSGDWNVDGDGTSITVPADAISDTGDCSIALYSIPDRKRCYGLQGVSFNPHLFTAEPRMVTVTFDANGGTASFESIRCAVGRPYGILPRLTRRGYGGDWYTAREGGERVESSSVAPSSDTTLHAQWNPRYYFIAYDANGGTGSMSGQCVYYDRQEALAALAFRREGHNFAGWGLSPDGPAIYADRQTIANLRDDYGTTTLYAIWNEIHITSPITGISVSGPSLIDLYDETGGQYRAVAICQDGTTVEVSPVWSVSGENINYAEMTTLGELYFSSDTYTVYQCATATVTAAYGGFTASARTEIYGPGHVRIEEYEIPQNAVWPGCTLAITPKTVRWWRHGVLEEPTSDFSGVRFGWSIWSGDWYANGDGTSIIVPADAISDTGDCSVTVHSMPDRERNYGTQEIWLNLHLCAADPRMVTVTFDANGGTASFGSMRCVVGKTYGALPELTRKGYYGYWCMDRKGGESVGISSIAPFADTTLYAQWYKLDDDSDTPYVDQPIDPPAYKVKFNANGGKLPKGKKMAAQTFAYAKSAKLRKNVFTRKGYVFAGWALSKANAKKGVIAFANAQKVSNLRTDGKTTTLYAVWAKKTYKVAFQANGGKGKMAVESFTYGKAKKLTANKFKAPKGKKFIGWAKSKADAKAGKVTYKNKAKVKNLIITGKTVKLYAVWGAK